MARERERERERHTHREIERERGGGDSGRRQDEMISRKALASSYMKGSQEAS